MAVSRSFDGGGSGGVPLPPKPQTKPVAPKAAPKPKAAAPKPAAKAKPKAKPAKKPPVPKLDYEKLASEYGWARAMVDSDPELKKLFSQAVSQTWTAQQFTAKLQATKWFQHHSATWRENWKQQKADPATWKQNYDSQRVKIAQAAVQMGAMVPGTTMDTIVKSAMSFGWTDEQIKANLSKYIKYSGTNLAGAAGDVQDKLRQLAYRNGVKVSDSTLLSYAKGIQGGTTSLQQAEDYVRGLAASSFPAFSEQIKAGIDLADVANPYMESMSDVLEINRESLNLHDPTVRKAMTFTGADGKPASKPIWQFENELRQDSRWKKTKKAQNELMSAGRQVLRDFGFGN